MSRTLTSCIAKAGDLLSNQDKAAVLRLARDYRSQGMTLDEAAKAALDEQLAVVGSQVDDAAAVEDVAREQAEVKQSSARTHPYGNAPDGLMGYRKDKPQAAFGEQAYKHVEFVRVSWPDGRSMAEAMTGLNKPHALERARRNWKDAEISAITRAEAEAEDPGIGAAVDGALKNISRSAPRDPQTETAEFKKWFGDSKVVHFDGSPMVLYHQTTKAAEKEILAGGFSTAAEFARARSSDEQVPNGIFLKANDNDIGVGSADPSELAQIAGYAAIQKPFVAQDRESLKWHWETLIPGYDEKVFQLREVDLEFKPRFDALYEGDYTPENSAATDKLLAEWDAAGKRLASEMRAMIDSYLAGEGYDGLILLHDKGSMGRTTRTYVALRSQQIKSATGNTGAFDATNPNITQSAPRTPWYSGLQQAIAAVPDRLANQAAPQWKLWLDANAAKLGVKKDEVEWSGIKEFLDTQGKAKVTREDIVAYLDANGVKIEEVVLGEGDWAVYDGDDNQYFGSQSEANDYAKEQGINVTEDTVFRASNRPGGYGTKYHSYTLPGGKNYRELLLTLPETIERVPLAQLQKRRQALVELKDDYVAEGDTDNASRMDDRISVVQAKIDEHRTPSKRPSDYKSSHWDAPNVVAHIRVDDRVDAGGGRVLFINEVQSDWSADGRKQGFIGDMIPQSTTWEAVDTLDYADTREEAEAKMAALQPSLEQNREPDMDNRLAIRAARGPGFEIVEESRSKAASAPRKSGVVPGPFVTETKAYVALALKRAIKLAVDEGYDSVAFVTGQQAADFFDLSKQVEQIEARKLDSGKISLSVDGKDGNPIFSGDVAETEVEDYVGKEMATRILRDTEFLPGMKNREATYRGLDLKVGGEGMKAFYDTLVPQVARDILKKMGGGKMEMISISQQAEEDDSFEVVLPNGKVVNTAPTRARAEASAKGFTGATVREIKFAEPQPGFAITDAMREKAAGGMVMFSAAREQADTPAFKAWFGTDSNLLDNDGAPLVLYHGTDRKFSQFNRSKTGAMGPAVYLGDDRSVAETYDGAGKGKQVIMAVYARGKYLSNMQWSDYVGKHGWTGAEAAAKADGWAGVHDTKFESAVAVWDPSNIKSAENNNGKFDAGKKSINQSAARDPQTETEAFKAWFGESKVVDADGTPLRVFHGTAGDFAVFDAEKSGRNYLSNGGDQGFFFTSNPGTASVYAEHPALAYLAPGTENPRFGKGTANIMPVYLSLQNPLIRKTKLSPDKFFDYNRRTLYEQAKERGADGVIIRGTGAHPRDLYVAFKSEQIKSAISNNGEFNPGSSDITQSTVRDRIDQAINQPKISIVGETSRTHTPEQLAAMRRVGFQVETPSLKDRAKALTQGLGKRLAQGIFDQFAPIKEIDQHAYLLTRLSKGASGAFESFLHGGKLKLSDGVYDFDETQKGGVLDKLLMPLQGEHHDMLRWVAANRAERLTAEGKENLFTAEDIAALKTLAQGQTAFDYTLQHGPQAGTVTRDRTAIYNDSLKTFNDFSDNIMDMAEQSGLIDGEARKMWQQDFYVPFYRVADDIEGGVRGMGSKGSMVRQEAFKKLKGGKNALNADLLDNTLMNWAHLLDASAKNRAAKATLEAAVNLGVAVEANETTIKQMGKSAKTAPVWFQDSGKQRFFIVEDPMLLAAISSLEYAGMRNPVMNAMSMFKHVLTVGVTASPYFKIRNLIRDSVQVIGTSPIGVNPAANIAQGWKLTDPKSDAYFRLLAGGGTIHFGTMLEGNEAKRIQALVESGVARSTILNDEHAVKAFYRKVIEPTITAYNELGNRGEAVNRAALYDQLVKGGMGHGEASLMARDLMDFSMSGSFTSVRFLTQILPFFNARLQGMYKLGRAAHEDPKRMAVVVGAIALASVALLAAYGDDEDWKKREEHDRNGFWWFKVGGIAYRIPKPFELGAIGTLAERGFEYMFDEEMTGKRLRTQVLTLLSDNLAMNPVPQAFKPILDVYSNKDAFSGRAIESASMERLRPEYRFTDRTSMVARATSTGLNAVTGLIGKDALSPVMIDQMLRGYFGWLGSFVVGSADVLARPLTSQPAQAKADLWKLATGNIMSDLRDAPSRYVSSMYDQAKELETAHGTWRMLVKSGKTEEAAEFKAEHQSALQRYRGVEDAKQAAGKLGVKRREIERSETMTAEEKREALRRISLEQDRIARLIK